ncbi:MAG TPA: peptidoglycan DD-metalloendopeptidase family protein [Pseudonocardiaceae bacterium]|nr:peptidoglycan DD-metalloendopeptidase family protein [Pseudonocardiaceae bacterium]
MAASASASASAELVAGQPAGQSAGQSAGPGAGLRAAVIAKIIERSGPGLAGTEVNVMREQPDWAFGAGIARSTRAEYPDGWLFVARLDGDHWVLAFEGEAGFPALAAAAPDGVVGDHEKQIFASAGVQANGDYRTGMRLPYAIGQSWRLTGGPHSTVRGSIDLAGGDGRVLAARAGTLYVMCSNRRGWLRIMHDRGYATDYYHLHNNRTDNGASVGAGAFLGNIGVDVSCGGSATGAHVHFSLRQNGSFVPIAGHDFGKWQPYNGASDYQGYALHGSTRVNVGGNLYNYGPLGFSQGIVDTNGGTVLNKRSGPGTGYAVVGTVADGATVSISCSANGTTHTGRSGNPTDLWNKLTDGTWVSDAYTWTGTTNPVSGWC